MPLKKPPKKRVAGTRKGVPAKKTSGKPPATRGVKVGGGLTYGELQSFLERLGAWWNKLGVDVAALRGLPHGFPPDLQVPGSVRERFEMLCDTLDADNDCAFPFSGRDVNC